MNKIGLITRYPLRPYLIKALPNVTVQELHLPENCDQLNEYEILIADQDLIGPHLQNLTKIKWIHSTWAGVDGFMKYISAPPAYTITRSYFGRSMTDYVLAQILNLERNLFDYCKAQTEVKWIDGEEVEYYGENKEYRLISELTVGILGTGAIGMYLAKTLQSLGAEVVGYKRSKSLNSDINFVVYTGSDLGELLKKCDYVVNILPATTSTTDILGKKILENCKKNAAFINIGRSNVIKEADILEALEKKWIRAVVLDVFDTEPLPKESKLWTTPQVHITPHIAGPARAKDVAETFIQNYQLYKENKPLPLTFNYTIGY